MKRLFPALLAVFLLCQPLGVLAAPDLSAASAILVDADSGRILYEKDAHTRRLIASTTKLMTALVAAEAMDDLAEPVTITREDTLTEGSSMYLKVGETVTLEALLYGLLLHSGNDAALAVARHCAGDVETFVDWMNQRAESLGMADSHFANPNGLNDDAHYSTAYDMALLAKACMDNETVSKIVGTRSITLGTRSFTNHNKLLTLYEGCEGMKTGYTQMAGRTLVSCARRDGQLLLCVTLNDPDDWKDHAALFDYGFETYPRQVLATAGRDFRTLPVDGSLVRFVRVRTAGDVFYPAKEGETVRAEVTLPDRVAAPVAAGEIAGSLSFYVGKELVGETYLLSADSAHNDTVCSNPLVRRVLDFFLGRSDTETFLPTFAGYQFS